VVDAQQVVGATGTVVAGEETATVDPGRFPDQGVVDGAAADPDHAAPPEQVAGGVAVQPTTSGKARPMISAAMGASRAKAPGMRVGTENISTAAGPVRAGCGSTTADRLGWWAA